jgi:Domain of unknown function (DUF4288)
MSEQTEAMRTITMNWFSATLISVVRLRAGEQESYPIWEDVCLIEAMDYDEAFRKAEALGKSRESDDPTLTLNGQPATIAFCGVRKIARVINPFDVPAESPPQHGSEIAFSKYSVSTDQDLEKLVQGESVTVVYEE